MGLKRPSAWGHWWNAGILVAALSACSAGDPDPMASHTELQGDAILVTIPAGASFQSVTDTLHHRGLVDHPTLFRLYARWKGADTQVRAGSYELRVGMGWGDLLDPLTRGSVVTEAVTIPEGLTLPAIAERLASVSGIPADSLLALLTLPQAHEEWGVPGPGLEGYLFPDTYRFAPGIPPNRVVRALVDRYHAVWTPVRRARKDSLGFTERELMTLASVVQAEARLNSEMPRIAAVFHNRLRIGMPLQSDPTVLYALGGWRPRLLYAAMDSVADHPYNTYTQGGLPPGPIGAPGEAAIQATLYPEDSDFLYFVAHPDGRHIFSRTLPEHNRAVAEMRRLR